MIPLPHRVRVIRPTVADDAYGTPARTYGTTGAALAAFVQPDAVAEPTPDGNRVVTGLRIFTVAELRMVDRVTWEGRTYQVTEAQRFDDPTGRTSHWEGRLVEVAG